MPSADSQRALETIIYTLDTVPELLEGVERIGFVRGQPHERLLDLNERMLCEQPYKPRATRLDEAGFHRMEALEGPFDSVMLLPERQKEQTLADLARGLDLLKEGGTLLVSIHNDWGARRLQDNLEELTGNVEVITKNHCRAFWARKTKAVDKLLLEEWRTMADLRRVGETGFWSKPGLFAWDRIDEGSALLAAHLPERMHGNIGDLGCGWGYLSCQVLERYEDVRTLEAFDADRDAVEAARRNVGNVKVFARSKVFWQDVTIGVADRRYDFVVMNPPFHEGREADPRLGMKFIASAARALKSTGEVWLVANRQLPYEVMLTEMFDSVNIVTQQQGFKVVRGSMPRHDLFFHRGKRGRR
jgi:16S rRNA (guanine1207-N2)-methyltransferase